MRTPPMMLKMLICVLCGLLAAPAGLLSAPTPQTTTEIEHKAPDKPYLPGRRIALQAEIKDKHGILAARCYFRTLGHETFTFVPLQSSGGKDYHGELPAPWIGSGSIEYRFLVVNQQKQVTLSESFFLREKKLESNAQWQEPGEMRVIRVDKIQETIEQYEVMKRLIEERYHRKYPAYQKKSDQGTLETRLELEQLGDGMQGFYDNFVVSRVPDSLRYGLAADGLYTSSQVAAAGGSSAIAATGATGAGTVTAAAGGSGAAVLIGAVALGAVGAGAYFASDALDDDEDDDGPVAVEEATAADFVGTFSVTDPTNPGWSGRFVFNSGGTGSYTETLPNGMTQSGQLNWSYNSNSQAFSFQDASGGGGATGQVSGNTDHFTINGHYANGRSATFVFSRS